MAKKREDYEEIQDPEEHEEYEEHEEPGQLENIKSKYYSREVVVYVWKDTNPVNIPGMGRSNVGHAALKIKVPNQDEIEYISWWPTQGAFLKQKAQLGGNNEGYVIDCMSEIGWRAEEKLAPYLEEKHLATTCLEKCYKGVEAIKREIAAKTAELRRQYSHNEEAFRAAYWQMKNSRDFEIELLFCRIKKLQKQLASSTAQYSPRPNQKVKRTEGHKLQFGVVPDYKVYIPIKGSIRLEDQRTMEYGLNENKMRDFWDDFLSDYDQQYKMISSTNNCSGVVLSVLFAGVNGEFKVKKPRISRPTASL